MTITYRNTKESALTYGEVDENFRDLYQDTTLQRVLSNGNTATIGMSVNSIAITGSAPGSPNAFGNPGQIAWDGGFIYVCVAQNEWKRAALTTWS